jgi:phospho-N-acetylmuramoyl-pentapeptide-transferase
MIIDIVKVFTPAALAFFVGIGITPLLTHYLYTYKAWKKSGGKIAIDGSDAVEFNKLHKEKEVNTPRLGGIVIWASVFVTTLGIWLLAQLFPHTVTGKLDFLSRDQTWIPLFTLIFGALVGFVDDVYEIVGTRSYKAGGLSLRVRLLIVGSVALFVAWWFFAKLEVFTINIPFNGELYLGWFIIPLFIITTLGLYASGVIDGIDGLSGGVFATIFAAYTGIAFYQQQINLAAFSATVVGAILAFLWFNIPPARFYMSETGTMGLTITLAVVAFMTDSLGGGNGVLVLPIVAFPLVVTVLSIIIQIVSKEFRGGKKVFLIAPLHHHFEAIGWPGYKVTMRYWVIGIIFALIGIIIALVG